jgi:hypothetical protein
MSALPGRWQPERLSPEARRMAETAARDAGLSLKLWLALTIRQVSTTEHASLSGAAVKALALLAETLRRGPLPPLDEARAYLRLVTEFQVGTDEIGAAVGRGREHVARALRLLRLPQSVRELIEQRALSAEHALALVDASDPESFAQAVQALGLAADETRAQASSEGASPAKGNG